MQVSLSHRRREAERFCLLCIEEDTWLTRVLLLVIIQWDLELKPCDHKTEIIKICGLRAGSPKARAPDVYTSLSRRHQRSEAGHWEGAEISPAGLSDLQEELQSLPRHVLN